MKKVRIEIDHGHGIATRYGHLRDILVTPGQEISHGQQIGTMGNSGRSTGPHLHYEVRSHDKALDPIRFLEAGGEATGGDFGHFISEMDQWTERPLTGALLLDD